MPRLRSIALSVALLLPTLVQAADLDHPYHHRRSHLPDRPPVVETQVVERVVVVHDRPFVAAVPVPTRVGGAFIFVPGLNGPDAAPVYPLLPFAFGYGY